MRAFAIIYLLILLFSISSGAHAQHISESELSLGRVAIGQSEKDVVKLHGAPGNKKKTGEGNLLIYRDFEVYVGVGSYGVFDVISKNPKDCTPSKVCPGTSISTANHLYGPPVVASRENGTYFEYTPDGSTCWLQVSAPNDIILSLRIACQP